jgi:menaquinone-dependent protoporphyrinogen oxidase
MDRVLVCYGTRYGSAGEIAERIADTLRGRSAEVDLVDLKRGKVGDISDYDLIVIGSGIQMGKWTKEPLKFLKKNHAKMGIKRVALFVSCLSTSQPTQCEKAQTDYLDKVVEQYPDVNFITTGLFGGLLDRNKGNALTKGIILAMAASMTEPGEQPLERIDLRDWDQITKWAESLLPEPF